MVAVSPGYPCVYFDFCVQYFCSTLFKKYLQSFLVLLSLIIIKFIYPFTKYLLRVFLVLITPSMLGMKKEKKCDRLSPAPALQFLGE